MDDVFSWLKYAVNRYKVPKTGIVHIGAHLCQELPIYQEIGFEHIIFVDPLLEQPWIISTNGNVTGIKCAIGKEAKRDVEFHVTTFDQASSLHRPLQHVIDKTIEVTCLTLAGVTDDATVLVLDCQGSEYDILSTSKLEYGLVVVETSSKDRYDNLATEYLVGERMRAMNYTMVASFPHRRFGMRDEVWIWNL